MKYAIYNRSANSYLTKMVFEGGYSNDTQFTCGLTEYITDAHLLDIKETADDIITDIESVKFMEKGCFVVHSFDETLDDQYIISEAGNPTKVVDNITVDLDGTINVKYGTMMSHWSTASLIYVINKLNRLQDASAPARYCSWNATFDIYKVITVIDENGHNHYQFINVTDKGIVSAKKEANSLAKRIEELEKSNYDLGEQVVARGAAANRLQEENDKLEAKVESIKREARQWKTMYESEAETLDILKDAIDTIYTDLQSVTASDDLKETSKALSRNSYLEHIFMPTKTSYILDNGNCLSAKDEICYIVDQIIAILESRELNQTVAFSSAEEVDRAKKLANDIIDVLEADDKFDITLKKFSELYKAVNDPSDDDDAIMYAFKGVLEILSSIEDHVRNIIDDGVYWKNKAKKAEKDKDNQKKLNESFNTTIVRYRNERQDIDKEIKELRTMRDCLAEIIRAIRNAICDNNGVAFDYIESRMSHDSDFNSSPFMAGARENIKDICIAIKRNLANNDLKNSEIAKAATALEEVNDKNEELMNMLTEITDYIGDIVFATKKVNHDEMMSKLMDVSCKIGSKNINDGPVYGISIILNAIIRIVKDGTYWERCFRTCRAKSADYEGLTNKLKTMTKERDDALEQKEFYKRQANSVYGMTVPCRCNGKQIFYDVTTGKKILVDKAKYNDLVKYVADINSTYDNTFCMMDKPVYLSAITEALNNLTK